MAQYNKDDYETVEERIRRFYKAHPDGRIITKNLTTLQDRQVSTWVVQAEIWLPVSDFDFIKREAGDYVGLSDSLSDLWILKSTGLAFEIDGQGMAQKTAALETAETSAIGRALANMNMSGNKRASREEMAKAERGITPKPAGRDFLADLEKASDVETLRELFRQATAAGASEQVIETIKAKAAQIAPASA